VPRIWFSGAEVAKHRNFLLSQGVEGVALNLGAYFQQRQPMELRDVYEGFDMALYSSEGGLDPAKVKSFINTNGDRFHLIYGLRTDHPAGVDEWSGNNVNDFYRFADGRQRVGIAEEVALDQQLMRFISSYASREDIELISTSAKGEALKHAWHDVILGGWVQAVKNRELQLWDGHRVVRYSRASRSDAAEKHHFQIERLGVEPQLIIDDNSDALMEVAVRSWLLYGAAEGKIVAITGGRSGVESAPDGEGGVAIAPPIARNRDRIALPVLDREMLPALTDDGEATWGPYRPAKKLIRTCTGCNLTNMCPSYEDGASCAFEVPVAITTKAELQHTQSSLLEIQFQRIAFARFSEDVLSQGLDPALSSEIERFFRMVESMQRSSSSTEQITITRKAEAGIMSRIFGADVGEANTKLATPMTPNELNATILDADVIDDIPAPPK
jgi:hypothetical protein